MEKKFDHGPCYLATISVTFELLICDIAQNRKVSEREDKAALVLAIGVIQDFCEIPNSRHVVPRLTNRMAMALLATLEEDGDRVVARIGNVAQIPTFDLDDQDTKIGNDDNEVGITIRDYRFVIDDAVIREIL